MQVLICGIAGLIGKHVSAVWAFVVTRIVLLYLDEDGGVLLSILCITSTWEIGSSARAGVSKRIHWSLQAIQSYAYIHILLMLRRRLKAGGSK